MHKRRREAPEESVLLALRALGAPVATARDASSALTEKRKSLSSQIVEPVIVAWDGKLQIKGKATIVLEDGSSTWPRQKALPYGYHRLLVDSKGKDSQALVISAPTRAHFPFSGKAWGAFAPVYALHSKRSFGAGDLADLETLVEWTSQRGGHVVSTLPLLATFLEEPFDPSPYSPISRLFWNEFYIDPAKAPEFQSSEEAQRLLAAGPPNRKALVDYRETMRAKRRVLEALSRSFVTDTGTARHQEFSRFLAENPEALAYARFRAVTDQLPSEQYHLYVQWLIQSQLRDLAAHSRDAECLLYLDLPLGLHPKSFDTSHYPHLFVKGMTGGAPPDPVFTTGQNWSFQPIHPQAMRDDGYKYVIAYVRNHLRYAKLLRIDHVMGLHRLYWIPDGLSGEQGLYVKYPAEEMYAILSLESHLANAGIVGENLGVVPAEVNRSMTRHNIRQLYVAQYETAVRGEKAALRKPPSGCVASLNTHDMFPFQAFIDGADIDARLKLGFITSKGALSEKKERRRVRKALERALGKKLFSGCMGFLEKSKASIVLQNLEDLWGETKPQNIPATTTEHANWRRRLRYSMERLRRLETKFSR
jgi:4-alpha-glucanotransferase